MWSRYNSMIDNLDAIIAAAERVYNSKQEEYNQSARAEDSRLREYYRSLSSSNN